MEQENREEPKQLPGAKLGDRVTPPGGSRKGFEGNALGVAVASPHEPRT